MKAKTVALILQKKHDELVKSIKDEAVAKLVQDNTIITGGCIASMLLREDANDYDMYFRDRATTEAVATYFLEQFKKNPPPRFKDDPKRVVEMWVDTKDPNRIRLTIKSAGIAAAQETTDYQYFETDPDASKAAEYVDKAVQVTRDAANEEEDKKLGKYRPVFLSCNAITLSHRVQLIIRFYGEPEEIHRNYDFDHCKSYWKSWDKQLVLPPSALQSLLARELRYSGSLYPLCSIIRTRKFIQRGWSITAGQYLKMCFQVSKLDLSDFAVLEEQLVGVDLAYFTQVLDALKEHDPTKVDQVYLMEVIDRLF